MRDAHALLRAFHALERGERVEVLRELNLVPSEGHVPGGDGREFRVWCSTALNRARRGYRPEGGEYVSCGSLEDVRDEVRRRLREPDGKDVGVFV